MDYEAEYVIRTILKERPDAYLIDWEDHAVTGEKYKPTWEPKANANKLAIDDWEAQKTTSTWKSRIGTQSLLLTSCIEVPGAAPAASNSTPRSTQPPKRAGRPRRKVIESSPDLSPQALRQRPRENGKSSTAQTKPRSEPGITETQEDEPIAEPTKLVPATSPQQYEGESPLFLQSDASRAASVVAVVEPSSPPSSAREGAYQAFLSSQTPIETTASQPAPSACVIADTPAKQLVQIEPAEFSSRVIPDSQSLNLLSSSVPIAGHEQVPGGVSARQTQSQPQPDLVLGNNPHGRDQPESHGEADLPERTELSDKLENPSHPRSSRTEQAPHLDHVAQPADLPKFPATHESLELTSTVQAAHSPVPSLLIGPLHTTHPDSSTQSASQVSSQPIAAEVSQAPDEAHTETAEILDPAPGAGAALTQLRSPTIYSSFPFETQIGLLQSSQAATGAEVPIQAQTSPAVVSSPDKDSSSIVSAPAYSLGPIGESAPPRPSNLSSQLASRSPTPSHNMDISQVSPTSASAGTRERLNALRQKYKTESQITESPATGAQPNPPSTALTDSVSQAPHPVSSLIDSAPAHRSPSAVPPEIPQVVATRDEMNTSERYETLIPRAEGPDELRRGSVRGRNLSRQESRVNVLPDSRHTVAIALVGPQRDHYSSEIRFHGDLVQQYIATRHPSAELIAKADRFVERMRHIALHTDLENDDTLSQYDAGAARQARYDVDSSSMFRFLKLLLEPLKARKLHIVVVAPTSRVLNMLDVFLTGLEMPHKKAVDGLAADQDSVEEGLRITITHADDDGGILSVKSDCIIALAPAARTLGGKSTSLQIDLIVPKSVEHVEQSIAPSTDRSARLGTLVSALYQLGDEAGKLADGQPPPDAAAAIIARYIAEPTQEWSLDSLLPLEIPASQTDSEVDEDSTLQDGRKRAHEAEDDEPEASEARTKKQRLTNGAEDPPTMTVNPSDLDLTHVSDSITKATESQNGLVLPGLSIAEKQLQDLLATAQEQLCEHVTALSDLQYRFEEQRKDLSETNKARDEALFRAERATLRMTEIYTTMSTLKEERTALKGQLEEANARLLNHSIPERVELETIRLIAAQAAADKKKLEERVVKLQAENNYIREMYQSSSQSAADLAGERAEMENALAASQNKATGEHARLRQMGYDARTKALAAETKKLKTLLVDREAGLRFRDEELARLREANRGRMGTRGSSVPRSPRLGSPMKLGRDIRSRQGSPTTGELKGKGVHPHPLRNS